jgi:hypothetical protein
MFVGARIVPVEREPPLARQRQGIRGENARRAEQDQQTGDEEGRAINSREQTAWPEPVVWSHDLVMEYSLC